MKTEIFPVPILPFGIVNAFILKTSNGCILIDAGLPGTESKVEVVLQKNNLSFKDIRYIVITHAHIDHAGNAFKLKQLTGAKIIGHENDLKYYLRQEEMTFCASGLFGKLFLKTGFIKRPYKPFQPDILIKGKESLDLEEMPEIKIISSPGHTPGSLSILLENSKAFVGDLISSGILIGGIVFKNRPKSPPFEDDPKLVADQLEKIVSCGCNDFYMGHGGPLNKMKVLEHAKGLRA